MLRSVTLLTDPATSDNGASSATTSRPAGPSFCTSQQERHHAESACRSRAQLGGLLCAEAFRPCLIQQQMITESRQQRPDALRDLLPAIPGRHITLLGQGVEHVLNQVDFCA